MASQASLNFAIHAVNEASAELKKIQADLDDTGGAAGKTHAMFAQLGAGSESLTDKIKDMAGPLLAAGAAMAAAFSVEKAIESAQELGKETWNLQQRIGGTAEQSSSLLAAFEALGIPADAATAGLSRMEKSLAGVGGTIDGEVIPAKKTMIEELNKMGVSVVDATGKTASMGSMLGDLAEWFRKTKDPAEKAAVSAQLFGRAAGPEMIPFLNQGRDGLDELSQKAKEMGVVLDDATNNKLHEQVLAQREFKEALKGVSVTIGTELTPVLTEGAHLLTDLAIVVNEHVRPAIEHTTEFFSEHKEVLIALALVIGAMLVPVLWTLIGAALAAAAPFIAIGIAIGGLVALIAILINHLKPAGESWSQVFGSMQDSVQSLGNFVVGVFNGIVSTIEGAINKVIDALNWINQKVPKWLGGGGDNIGHVDFSGFGGALAGMAQGALGLAQQGVGAVKGFFTADASKANAVDDNAIFDPNTGGGANAGGAAGGAAAKTIASVMKQITEAMSKEVTDAYIQGSDAQADTVRASQKHMLEDVTTMAQNVHDKFGVDMPTAMEDAFKKMDGDAQKYLGEIEKYENTFRTNEITEYMKHGEAAADLMKASDAKMLADAQAMAGRLHQQFGIDLPTALSMSMTTLLDQAKALKDATDAAAKSSLELTKQLWAMNPNMSAAAAGGMAAMASAAAKGITGSVGANGVFTPNAPVADMSGFAALAAKQGQTLGQYAEGGVVPGPVGAPQLAIVHGGEEWMGVNGQRSGGLQVIITGDVYGFDDFQSKAAQALREAIQSGGFRGVIPGV